MADRDGVLDPSLLTQAPFSVARAVADSVVVHHDPDARAANAYYWERTVPLFTALEDAVTSAAPGPVAAAARALAADPVSPDTYRETVDRLHRWWSTAPDGNPRIHRLTRTIEESRRISYHLGPDHLGPDHLGPDHPNPSTRDVGVVAPTPDPGCDDRALVVIPFRDDGSHPSRRANLATCLASLRDQDVSAEAFDVVVVESDTAPTLDPGGLGCELLFAYSDRPFNKSWAVNVGCQAIGREHGILCVLDADAVVDRGFVGRNVRRFRRPGTAGFHPFRDVHYLDARSGNLAHRQRVERELPSVDLDTVRSFVVHRPPGMCVWLRRSLFERVGGMDERYQGWGREDLDFALRLQLAGPFVTFDDPMLHLHHPSSVHLVDGETVNAHLPFFSWAPTRPIGDPNRYRDGPQTR